MSNDTSPVGQGGLGEDFQDWAENFTQQTIFKFPELQSVLVIPVWTEPAPLPIMLASGRHGSLKSGVELLGAIQQLCRAKQLYDNQLLAYFIQFDQIASSLAKVIHERQTELDQLNSELAKRQQPLGVTAATDCGNDQPADSQAGS